MNLRIVVPADNRRCDVVCAMHYTLGMLGPRRIDHPRGLIQADGDPKSQSPPASLVNGTCTARQDSTTQSAISSVPSVCSPERQGFPFPLCPTHDGDITSLTLLGDAPNAKTARCPARAVGGCSTASICGRLLRLPDGLCILAERHARARLLALERGQHPRRCADRAPSMCHLRPVCQDCQHRGLGARRGEPPALPRRTHLIDVRRNCLGRRRGMGAARCHQCPSARFLPLQTYRRPLGIKASSGLASHRMASS